MSFFIEGDTGRWEVVLGLEVHAQIKSNSKLFQPLQLNGVVILILKLSW